jgi:hypothetical protein
MTAVCSRGVLRWIRRPAAKRAVWAGCYAARALTPPPDVYGIAGRGFFVPCAPLCCASNPSIPPSCDRYPGIDLKAPSIMPETFSLALST